MATSSPSPQSPPPVPFAFKDHQIRTVVDGDGKPWFVAKDVCGALGISWQGLKTLSAIPEGWRRVGKLPTRTRDGRGQVNEIAQVAEPAVYKLAFRSNKPEADEFTNWVASEVLPAIRKTGSYGVSSAPASQTPGISPTPAKVFAPALAGLSRARHHVLLAMMETKERSPFIILSKAFCELAYLTDNIYEQARH